MSVWERINKAFEVLDAEYDKKLLVDGYYEWDSLMMGSTFEVAEVEEILREAGFQELSVSIKASACVDLTNSHPGHDGKACHAMVITLSSGKVSSFRNYWCKGDEYDY